jgi:hypothetical protein
MYYTNDCVLIACFTEKVFKMASVDHLKNKNTRTAQLSYSLEGRSYADRFAKALQTTPIGLNILGLAWTAGPVTFIALYIGYYIGFGVLPPTSLFIYFAFYTLISGIISVIVKVFTNNRQQEKIDATKAEYMHVIEQLFNAYFITRDLRLNECEPSARKYLATEILLSNIFIEPETLKSVVEEICNNEQLAKQSYRIVTLRRSGMISYADGLLTETLLKYTNELETLQAASPKLHAVLLQHLQGKIPSLKQGILRNPGFLERITSTSTSQGNTIELLDVQEIIGLTLEILMGRKFTYISFKFQGTKEQRETFKAIEKFRHELISMTNGYFSSINAL